MVDQLVNTDINKKRIAFVESCFGSAGLPLAVKGRVLVGEGILTKACRKKPKPRQFFLFDDIVVYGNILINKKKYNKQRVIPLEEVKLQSLEDDGQFRNGWLICTRGKSFAVYAATAKEKDDWMSHIQRCIDDLLSSSGKKKPSDEHAAVWIPDSEAHSCMVCNKSHFTVLNRRHHCRQCGAVVCGSCSTNRFLIPSQSSKPIRVCDTCYGTLNINKSSKNSSINDLPKIQSETSSLFNDGLNIPELEDLPPIPQDNFEINIPRQNLNLYELVNITETSPCWFYDENTNSDRSESFFDNFEQLSLQYDDEFECFQDHKNVYSSGEDESDEDEQNDSRRNDKESHESYWYDSSTRIVSGVATLPAITAHDLNLSPLSQISPLPRAASSKK
ncbi:Pleckstrin homology domain-containing family F member 2,Pleckstrin homology domain-containing family F member 1 homolog,Uncharacterized protein ZK632.12,Pleckstrin homology domain-containing family F member 1 [Lepeophtheirus salmonis]|uniref:Pleckstrin homology domain-containing family F member 2 n=1 Tax=Lepeophtheirus salmonis TaxID=72036 RepID=A0A7R8HDS3_LEPSM|nr:Pleckstrin homology domain-containing family F member 2,Pleckstrin homology domain-containing family F member 1 homolog,Uncharacterized protein ZK632.12,Pleckstrin homology domain-containing family F member 1 [Lepeophtheirus salmonis]CAF3028715.1 Pleckstrin homology domain-containing family F member 2,Pleckstrin homology domain-containing family F member 1 homolog,Uncharacterized protein ZK632.12,Pleckstrin homology domain-containing family F member 1 [Lepeophtheirus salmonis]